ncbi:UMTA methyltransferase [Colletotrichum orchidophilum]|uniref:UMTA methyltransferase n=1 Tax=Colletotrichum orchidophilum TaxID=1209926 RepID=A0A1G4B281_9PEZI|nr:UMTA methyltransferase [Colletotrichum orchidophilum]OHE95539.1 UMTA methyltransferase [Colletotrichum orchidophilum]
MDGVFENAEVIGIDPSPIQPEWVLPNVKFEIDIVESPRVHERKYNLIMCRYMVASIKNWPGLIKNIFDRLSLGGWVESQDVNTELYSDNDTFNNDFATAQWVDGFAKACKGMRPLVQAVSELLGQRLEEILVELAAVLRESKTGVLGAAMLNT